MRVPYATPRILHLVRQHICRRHSSRRPPGRAEGHWPASATPAPIPWVCLYRWSPKKQKSSWSRRGRAGSLAVATRRTPELPEGSRLSLQVAHRIGEQLKPHQPPVEEFDDPKTDADNRRRLRIPVSPSGSHTLGTVQLPWRTAAASRTLVHIPPERHHKPHKVIIRQLYKGRGAGRITWVLLLSATGTDRTGFMRIAEACCSL
jgi:hypothetical protein